MRSILYRQTGGDGMSCDRGNRVRGGQVLGVLTLALLVTMQIVPAAAQQGNPEVQEHLNNAINSLSGDNPNTDKALEELDEVLGLDPQNAQAYYYRGIAFGQTQQLEEALDSFVRAGELSPGYTDAHVYACRLAWQFQNWDLAWEQAIYASQSGFDMSQAFAELRQMSDEPDDLEQRLRAPRVLLGGVDVEAITGQDSFLNEPATVGGAADAGSRGAAGSPAASSLAFGDGPSGGTRLAESRADLANVRRTFGILLQESDDFAVVQNPELSTYVLTLKVNDVGVGRPRDMQGIVKLMKGEEEAYSRPLRLSDIGSTAELRTEIFRHVVFMEEWLAQQER